MLIALALALVPARVVLHVSPNGNDAWSGTMSRPLATIQEARNRLRKIPADTPATVEIEAGTYRIKAPIFFGPEDSGKERIYEGLGKVRVTGLVRITGWHKLGNGYLQTTLPEVRSGGWTFSQLFVNGERRFRPRLPKKGYYTVADHRDPTPESKGHGNDRFAFDGGQIKNDWANRDDVEVVAFHIWSMSRNRIKSVDEATHTVTFKAPTGYEASWDDFVKGGRYLVENVKEALSDPGEWYLDRPTGELTYIPKPGEKANNIEVEAPLTPDLIQLAGDEKNRRWIEGIHIKNLNLEGGNWNLSPTGRNYPQAEADLSGEIKMTGTRNCSLENCTIRHAGQYAVEIGHACQDIRVAHCTMEDLGAGGVKIGEQNWEKDPELQTAKCEITDNIINGGGRLHPAAVGVWVGQNPFISVTGNTIHDLYYTGISVGWSWGYQPNGAHDNTIADNRISQIGQGVLSDMGGIYTLGPQPNTVLRGNRIHDVQSFSYGGWGIYPDEGSSGLLIENNCVFRCKSAGFHQHYGEKNRILNNVFAFGGDSQVMRTRAEDHLSFTFEHNIVYWKTGPLLGSNWSGNNYKLDWNTYYRTDGKTIDFAGMVVDAWRAKGQDVHSILRDPLFRNAGAGDFRLQKGSPDVGHGFTEFPALAPLFESRRLPTIKAGFTS
jgi:hypothetical protein